MSEIIALDSISVANVENIFWTNGSRLKPNQLVHGTQFKIVNGVRPVWINQEIVGWIILEGEYNYAIYNGVYYFLSKTTVADQGTAWIYTLTKDYWANWLSRGVRVKGDVNRTDDRKLILNYLDHVVPLVPDPCVLVRVPFDEPEWHWADDLVVQRPNKAILINKSFTREDWDRFYSQAKNIVKPKKINANEIKHPIILAELKATGRAKFKDEALSTLENILDNLQDYYPGRVTTFKNSIFTYNLCLTTLGRFGVRPSSLTNKKEYIKITKLDFSGLTDIRPVKISGLDSGIVRHVKTPIDADPVKPTSFNYNPLQKIYREVCPRYYLPVFDTVISLNTRRLNESYKSVYKGNLAQYVRLPNNPKPRAFLYAIPDSFGYASAEGDTIKFRRLDKYIYYNTGILLAPTPYDGVYFCHPDIENLNIALTSDGKLKVLSRIIPKDHLTDADCPQGYSDGETNFTWGRHMSCRNPMRWKYWNNTTSRYDASKKALDPVGQWNYNPLAFQYKPVDIPFSFGPGSYFWTSLSGYVRETDEYDSTDSFLNYGVGYPDQETREVELEPGLVIAYCGRGLPGFRFMVAERATISTTLIEEGQKANYVGIGFPARNENVDVTSYDKAPIDPTKPYYQTLNHLRPLDDYFEHDDEVETIDKDRWITQLNKEKSKKAELLELLKAAISFVATYRRDWTTKAPGSVVHSTWYPNTFIVKEDDWISRGLKNWNTTSSITPYLEEAYKKLFGERRPIHWEPFRHEDLTDENLFYIVFSETWIAGGATYGSFYWSTDYLSIEDTAGSVAHDIIGGPFIGSAVSSKSYALAAAGFRVDSLRKFLYLPWVVHDIIYPVNHHVRTSDHKTDEKWHIKTNYIPSRLSTKEWWFRITALIRNMRRYARENLPYVKSSPDALVELIQSPKLAMNFYKSINKGYLIDEDDEDSFIYEDEAADIFKVGDIRTYDLIGTNFYLIIDLDGKGHLVFKSYDDLIDTHRRSFEITKKDIPQSFVDVISNRNILRVYSSDFDLNERIKWDDPSWRGSTPTIEIRHFSPIDKVSTLETLFVNYQGVKANIDARIQIPKEEIASVEVDVVQVDQLNLDLQKWNTSYVEKRRYKEEEIEREREKHQERRELQNIKWNEAAVNTAKLVTAGIGKVGSAITQSTNILGGALSVSGALAEIGASAAEHIYARQKLGIETEALKKDIALEVSKMALSKFNLDHEHHWKHREYKFAMEKLGVVYNKADANDRSIVENYVDEFHLTSPIFLMHYKPSTLQRELAEVIFKNFGCECLIDGVTLEIKDGMDPGIWGFVEVLEHYSIFEETERTLCSELLKNGVKIQPWSAEIKTPIDPQVEEQSWIEKLSSLVSMRNEETKEHLIRALFNHIEADKAFKVITELTKSRPGFIKELTNSITDANLQEIIKARGGKSIFTEEQVNQKILQERKICANEKDQIRAETRREIEEAKKIAENSINIAKADASKQIADALSKKQTFEELAKSQTNKLNQEIAQRNKIQEDLNKAQSNLTRVNSELTKAKADLIKAKANLAKFHKLPLAILHLYKPIFDSVARVLSKTLGNARFGFNYGARDVSILELEDFLFKPKEERAGYGCSRKYAACIYMASYQSEPNKAVQVDLRQDLIEESGKQDWLTDRTWQQMESKFGDEAKKTKQWNTFVDTTRNFIYPKGGSLGEVPVLFGGKIVNLQEKNDKKLYWDSSEGNFIWMSGTPNAERYIPIPDKDSWNKLLTGELLGISKN